MQFSGRLVHPQGPIGFPKDPSEDRDDSRDPRSVFVLAETQDEAEKIMLADNAGFKLHSIKAV